jgi:hypothetical protein
MLEGRAKAHRSSQLGHLNPKDKDYTVLGRSLQGSERPLVDLAAQPTRAEEDRASGLLKSSQ